MNRVRNFLYPSVQVPHELAHQELAEQLPRQRERRRQRHPPILSPSVTFFGPGLGLVDVHLLTLAIRGPLTNLGPPSFTVFFDETGNLASEPLELGELVLEPFKRVGEHSHRWYATHVVLLDER